jgi:zinc protease
MLKKCLFVFLLLAPLLSAAQVHEYMLDNGLKLLVKEDHRAPVVYSSVWYKVGGSYEHNGITGISHVLEHMMFRGTTKYPSGSFEKIISEMGGEQNAMTGNDQTIYYEKLASDKLPISFELEADRMHNLVLTKEIFAKEIQVVMEERRMRYEDNPQALTWERFMAAAHVNNPYHHQAIGWMTDLQNMTVQNVRDWYHQWYAPNNAFVLVIGDVKADDVYQLAVKYFGKIPKSTVKTLKPRTEIPTLGHKQIDVFAPAKLPWIVMGFPTPTAKTAKNKSDPYALVVLSAILGGGDSSRFARDLIRGSQIAADASASFDPFTLHQNQFLIDGIPAKGITIDVLKKKLLAQVEKMKAGLVTVQELERVKAQVIAANVFSQDSLSDQAMDLGTPESIGLSWRDEESFVDNIKLVTAQQIQAVAKKYLKQQNLTTAVLHATGNSSKMPMPSQPLPSAGVR